MTTRLDPFQASPTWRHGGWLLLAIVALGVIWRLAWAELLVFNRGSDEMYHEPMVRYLADRGRLPTMRDVPETIPVSYPALPPLGYVPAAFATRWGMGIGTGMGRWWPASKVADRGNDLSLDIHRLRLARWANGLLAGVMLLVAGMALRDLAPGRPVVGWAVLGMLALWPQLVFLQASINNDTTMLAAVAGVWWMWIRIGRFGITPGRAVGLGVLAAVALLAKLNAVGVILAGLPLVWLDLRRDPSRTLQTYALGGIAGGLCLMPWMWWSWTQHGSWMGQDVHRAWWFQFIEQHHIEQGFLTLDRLAPFLWDTWKSSWASFGYQTTELADGWYGVIGLIALVASTRFMFGLYRVPRWLGWIDCERGIAMSQTLMLGVIFVLGLHLYHSHSFGYSPQGRYLAAAVFSFATILVVGLLLPFHANPILLSHGEKGRKEPDRRSLVIGVALLAGITWLTVESYQCERNSYKLRQPDPRVRAEPLAFRTALPGRNPTIQGLDSTSQIAWLPIVDRTSGPHSKQAGELLVLFERRDPNLHQGRFILETEAGCETIPFRYPGFPDGGAWLYRIAWPPSAAPVRRLGVAAEQVPAFILFERLDDSS